MNESDWAGSEALHVARHGVKLADRGSMRIPTLVVSLLLLTCAAALAQEDCGAADTTVAMVQCFMDVHDSAELEIAGLIGKLQAFESESGRQLLLDAQKAWEAYRQTHCLWEGSEYEGGTMARVVRASCGAALTRERASLLRGRLEERVAR